MTNVNAEKMESSQLEIYKMVIALFQINHKIKKFRFIKRTFLLIDISINVAIAIYFLTLSNLKVNFNNRELR